MILASILADYLRYFTLALAVVTAVFVSVRAWKLRRVWAVATEMAAAYLAAIFGLSGAVVALIHHSFRWYATPLLLVACVLALHAFWVATATLGGMPRASSGELNEAQRARFLLRMLAAIAIPLAGIALIPTLVGFYRTQQALDQAKRLSLQNRNLIVRSNRERLERRKDVNATQLLICKKVNDSNRILATLLVKLTKLPPTTATAQERRNREVLLREFAAALKKLRPQNCQKLPIAKTPTTTTPSKPK